MGNAKSTGIFKRKYFIGELEVPHQVFKGYQFALNTTMSFVQLKALSSNDLSQKSRGIKLALKDYHEKYCQVYSVLDR